MTLLRYPGGKSQGTLHRKIMSHIESHYNGGWFAEPFFGGGGVSVALLKKGLIDKLVICEKDPNLLALWKQVANQPNRIIHQIEDLRPSVQEFRKAKDRILGNSGSGFDALVANRLSHSGRGVMAGPQGGLGQTGKYKIGCRWNPEKMIKEIVLLSSLFSSITVKWYNDYSDGHADYYYVDPPYWRMGQQMYQHSFGVEDHVDLKRWLDSKPNWLLSYDNHPEVRSLYSDYNQEVNTAEGNGGKKKDSELLIWT